MRTLKRINKLLKKAMKNSTCDSVCLAYLWGKQCERELNDYTPKNNKEQKEKERLLELAEDLVEWASYWSQRIAQ